MVHNGFVMDFMPLLTDLCDNFAVFGLIFTDFENFRFVFTPLSPHFQHFLSLDRCENRQKIVKTRQNRQNSKIAKNHFLSSVTYGPAMPCMGFLTIYQPFLGSLAHF